MDLKLAFLNGYLVEGVYFMWTLCFTIAKAEHKLFYLWIVLFGLWQSSQTSNKKLHTILNHLEFEQSPPTNIV